MGPDLAQHLTQLLGSCEIVDDNPKMHLAAVEGKGGGGLPRSTSMPRLVSCLSSATPQDLASCMDEPHNNNNNNYHNNNEKQPRRYTAPSSSTMLFDHDEFEEEKGDELHELPLLTTSTSLGGGGGGSSGGGGFHSNLTLLLQSQDAALSIISDNPKSHINKMSREASVSKLGSCFSASCIDRFTSHQSSRWEAGLNNNGSSSIGAHCGSPTGGSGSGSGNISLNAQWDPSCYKPKTQLGASSLGLSSSSSRSSTTNKKKKQLQNNNHKNRLQNFGLTKPNSSSSSRSSSKNKNNSSNRNSSHHHRNNNNEGTTTTTTTTSSSSDPSVQNATWMPMSIPKRSKDVIPEQKQSKLSSSSCRWSSIPQIRSDSNLIYPKRVTG